MAVGTPDSPERSVMEPFSGKAMKSQFGLDAGMVERLRSVAHSGVALSLLAFFVSVILLGGEIGDPTFAEDLASISSLAIALNGFSYISLGLSAARIARHDDEARRADAALTNGQNAASADTLQFLFIQNGDLNAQG